MNCTYHTQHTQWDGNSLGTAINILRQEMSNDIFMLKYIRNKIKRRNKKKNKHGFCLLLLSFVVDVLEMNVNHSNIKNMEQKREGNLNKKERNRVTRTKCNTQIRHSLLIQNFGTLSFSTDRHSIYFSVAITNRDVWSRSIFYFCLFVSHIKTCIIY